MPGIVPILLKSSFIFPSEKKSSSGFLRNNFSEHVVNFLEQKLKVLIFLEKKKVNLKG